MKKRVLVLLFIALGLPAFADGQGTDVGPLIVEMFLLPLILTVVQLIFSIISIIIRRKKIKIASIVVGSLAFALDLLLSATMSGIIDKDSLNILHLVTGFSFICLLTVILAGRREKGIN